MEKIEFVDLKAQSLMIGEDIKHSINQVISHGKFIMGPEVNEFEKNLETFTGVQHAVSCASGTDALLMALMAIGIKPGDAVFTTPFTFIATAEVVSLLGAIPVFVDIDKTTFNIDPVKLAEAVETIVKSPDEKLIPRCIIPVDIFGLSADYKKIAEIAAKYNLKVIADGAQSLGSQIGDKMACDMTDIATTSFFPAKPLGCYGDGGAIFTSNSGVNEKLRSIRVHGKGNHKYDNVRLGVNGRMDTIQAAILIEKLKIFKNEIEKREIVAREYQKRIGKLVQCQHIPENYKSAWAQFSFLSKDRTKVMNALEMKGIPHAIYYPKPLHLQEAFSKLNYKKGDFPVAERVAETILSIPMHPYLSDDQVSFISQTIVDALS